MTQRKNKYLDLNILSIKRKTLDQNTWDTVEVVLKGIALNTFIKEEERLKVNKLSF